MLDAAEQSWKMKSWEAGKIPFGKELYIEREDFMEEPPKKVLPSVPGQ